MGLCFILKTVLVTGASGFIGKAVCRSLFLKYRVIALDRNPCSDSQHHHIAVTADIEDVTAIKHICDRYLPDVVIHCAGMAHQTLFLKKGADSYEDTNCLATEKLAHCAAASNPGLYFIFLSSISVYGENQAKPVICETDPCLPTSHYAKSKLSAEKRLIDLYHNNILKKLDILRLAPVYDNRWGGNLEKRVFAPHKICYLRLGSGEQKMSALARANLIEFIGLKLKQIMDRQFCNITNVCDEQPYSFNEIIGVFQKTRHQPRRMVVDIPLHIVGMPALMMGGLLKNQAPWIRSFYYKLAKDSVFDNKKMLDTGFKPRWSLSSVFINNGIK